MAGPKKTAGPPRAKAGRARTPAPPALPDPAGDAPLEELSRDALSVLLYVWLLPEEARALVKDLRLSVPGFRTDALGDVELCDVLADEIRAAPETRRRVLERLRAAFGGMPIPDVPLDPPGAPCPIPRATRRSRSSRATRSRSCSTSRSCPRRAARS